MHRRNSMRASGPGVTALSASRVLGANERLNMADLVRRQRSCGAAVLAGFMVSSAWGKKAPNSADEAVIQLS